jgi:hypothetical protein
MPGTEATKRHAPAAARNQAPICEVLARELPPRGSVLELASGSGEHAVAFARAFPALTWQPSDASDAALASIAAWRAEAQLANLCAPVALDVTAVAWPVAHADAIVCINMVHISPWEAALGMLAGASRLLAPGALLYLYGSAGRSPRSRTPRSTARSGRAIRGGACATPASSRPPQGRTGWCCATRSRCRRTTTRWCSARPEVAVTRR